MPEGAGGEQVKIIQVKLVDWWNHSVRRGGLERDLGKIGIDHLIVNRAMGWVTVQRNHPAPLCSAQGELVANRNNVSGDPALVRVELESGSENISDAKYTGLINHAGKSDGGGLDRANCG